MKKRKHITGHLNFLLALVVSFFFLNFFPDSYSHVWAFQSVQTLQGQFTKLNQQGRFNEAVPIAEEILSLQRKTFGDAHPEFAKTLADLARVQTDLGNHAEAKTLNQRALAIFETLNTEHLYIAACLNNLALNYGVLGDYQKAESLHKRALSIWEKAFGSEHPNVAKSVINLANLYSSRGESSKARPLYERALEIRMKLLGPDDPGIAFNLNDLANTYASLELYLEAEPLYRKALSIREKAYGGDHPSVAESLNNLAMNCGILGKYGESEKLHQQALAIREKILGPEHPAVANSLSNLAMIYTGVGSDEKALPLLQRALAILEKTLGPGHPKVATILEHQAGVYGSLGEYERQEPLLQKALAINEKAFGPEHPAVAGSMISLANYYNFLLNPLKAEPLMKRALAIFEKTLGPEHTAVCLAMINLASLYSYLGEYGKAEKLLNRTVATLENTYGPEHPFLTPALNNLAGDYVALGKYTRAEQIYQRVLTIFEKKPGYERANMAGTMQNLAELYKSLGQYIEAELLYEEALRIFKEAEGTEHPLISVFLTNMALFYAGLSNYKQALCYNQQAVQIDDKLIEQMIMVTSENQRIRFLSNQFLNLYSFLSLVSQHMTQNSFAVKDALNIWLKRKGLVLETNRKFQRAFVSSGDPRTLKNFQELSSIRTELSKALFANPGKGGMEAHRKRIVDLEQRKEKAEIRLVRHSRPYAAKLKKERANVKTVSHVLPAGSALVEFASVPMFNFQAKAGQTSWLPPHYLAFILFPDRPDDIRLIDLGNADVIDNAIAAFKEKLFCQSESQNLRAIRPMGLDSDPLAQKLYTLVFKPIHAHLENTKTLFISPDGNLNLLPFETIRMPDGRYLIEDFTFNYLSSGRDVLDFGEPLEKSGKSLIIGDPDFDMNRQEMQKVLARMSLKPLSHFPVRQIPDMPVLRFKPLHGALTEVRAIHALLGEKEADLYTGKKALESVLMQCSSPKYLHLATHGFFLRDRDVRLLEKDERIWNTFKTTAKTRAHPARLIRIGNPLCRSGLALAGANTAMKNTELYSGILTAEKILNLNLYGTEMVVLSACETGLGKVRSSEGVFGLRRAFSAVGARSLVMSLWPVPDQETKEFMIQFYKNILFGMDRCQALRQAALTQMEIVNERYGNKNPFFWGAFIFMGKR